MPKPPKLPLVAVLAGGTILLLGGAAGGTAYLRQAPRVAAVHPVPISPFGEKARTRHVVTYTAKDVAAGKREEIRLGRYVVDVPVMAGWTYDLSPNEAGFTSLVARPRAGAQDPKARVDFELQVWTADSRRAMFATCGDRPLGAPATTTQAPIDLAGNSATAWRIARPDGRVTRITGRCADGMGLELVYAGDATSDPKYEAAFERVAKTVRIREDAS